jgi:hypothetical protein
MTRVAERGLAVKFPRTSNVTVAGPVPVRGEVRVIQSALFETAQLQAFPVVRLTEPDPSIEEKNWLEGEI